MQSTRKTSDLLELGYRLLEQKEFKAAEVCFEQVLKAEPQNAAAFWGSMLSSRQCTETRALYTRLAVPIGRNSDFSNAVKYASPQQKSAFQKFEQLVLLACHQKILQNFVAGNAFLTKKWLGHYSAATPNGSMFRQEHEYISECLEKSKLGNCSKLFLSIYVKYKTLPDLGDPAYFDELLQFVRENYVRSMNLLREVICKKADKATIEELKAWADPVTCSPQSLSISG